VIGGGQGVGEDLPEAGSTHLTTVVQTLLCIHITWDSSATIRVPNSKAPIFHCKTGRYNIISILSFDYGRLALNNTFTGLNLKVVSSEN
jgi:hypothetical protein